jgi:hypothetical protein
MIQYIYIKDAKFEDVERAIKETLAEVDAGKHDRILAEAGVKRPPEVVFSRTVALSQSQGASPEEWMKLAVELAPLAITIGGGIWKIVIVPKLKKLFREDRVKEEDPKKKTTKKKRR